MFLDFKHIAIAEYFTGDVGVTLRVQWLATIPIPLSAEISIGFTIKVFMIFKTVVIRFCMYSLILECNRKLSAL